MKSLKQTYTINAPKEKVWEALVNPQSIDDWGAGPADMNDEQGKEFKLWGGDVYGTNKEVVKNEKLVQDWYGGEWDQPSIVTIILTESNGKTKVDLTHENIPDVEYVGIKDGWKDYYFVPLKELVEMS